MKPFQPNPQQLEAITNGATKLWIPAKHDIANVSTDTITFLTLANEEQTWNLSEYLAVFSPLQPGESYFVQEEFSDLMKDSIWYKRVIDKVPEVSCKLWKPADQMTEAQSQYKLTVTDVEVKSVQDNYGNDKAELAGQSDNWLGYADDKFEQWYDSQYPNQPYSSSPTGFLITIERIKDVKEN